MAFCIRLIRSLYFQQNCWLEMSKVRLVLMVVFTAFIGYFAALPGTLDWVVISLLFWGTFFSGCASHILNQYFEKVTDALMVRTQNRPLPSGRFDPKLAIYGGCFLGILGCFFLFLVSIKSALLCLLTILGYVFLYTPLKKISVLNTWVGAVFGAIPVLVGYYAVNDSANLQVWILFGILFIWQIPHFLALAWIYQKDYKNSGLKMLIDKKDGRVASWVILLHGTALITTTALSYFYVAQNLIYLLIIIVLNFFFLLPMVGFLFGKKDFFAKQIFLASILYLPMVFFSHILIFLG